MDTISFHLSTGKELLALKDRVRNLVPHWGEDGRYKEAVLKTVIKRFLPEKYSIASGFVVKQTVERDQHEASKQIDIIIYDKAFPVLFKEGDFVILTPDAVCAIIEVKTNMKNLNIYGVLETANNNGRFILDGKSDKRTPLFNGIFSFEGISVEDLPDLKTTIDLSNESLTWKFDDYSKVNHIAFNNSLFYKFWLKEEHPNKIYEIDQLSFSFFIGNLMDYLGGNSVTKNRNLWFPVDKSVRLRSEF